MNEQLLGYLSDGFVTSEGLNPSLDEGAYQIARHWLSEGVQPQSIEMQSELLARVAEQLGAEQINRDDFSTICRSPVLDLLVFALPTSVDSHHCAAAAVHILDIAEQMALQVYVAELPSLLARADRSGDAARKVGAARHLRG